MRSARRSIQTDHSLSRSWCGEFLARWSCGQPDWCSERQESGCGNLVVHNGGRAQVPRDSSASIKMRVPSWGRMRLPPTEGGRSPTGVGGSRKDLSGPCFARRLTPLGGRGGREGRLQHPHRIPDPAGPASPLAEEGLSGPAASRSARRDIRRGGRADSAERRRHSPGGRVPHAALPVVSRRCPGYREGTNMVESC